MSYHASCMAVLFVVFSLSVPALCADPTFSRPVDSGAIDLAATSFNSATSTVTVGGACTYWNATNPPKYEYWWEYFQMSNIDTSKTYKFSLDQPKYFGTDTYYAESYQSFNRWVYSYDNVHWNYFDNGSYVNGQPAYTFNGKFTQSSVYIANGIPFTMGMVNANTVALKTNPYVKPTKSSNSDFVFAQTLGGTDFYGRAIPQQNLYSYQITDTTATGTKQKIVIMTGTHSGEAPGTWTCQGLLNFLTSSDPRAVQLRRKAIFYVYPEVDPDGRYGGYFRNNQLAPLKQSDPTKGGYDSNRNWNSGSFDVVTGLWSNRPFDGVTGSFDNETKVINAIRNDTGGGVDYFLDFHAQRNEQYSLTNGQASSSEFGQALLDMFNAGKFASTNASPAIKFDPSNAAAPGPNTSTGWAATAYSAGGLGAAHVYTIETGFLSGVSSDQFMTNGREYFGEALYEAVVPEPVSMAILAVGGLAMLRRRK